MGVVTFLQDSCAMVLQSSCLLNSSMNSNYCVICYTCPFSFVHKKPNILMYLMQLNIKMKRTINNNYYKFMKTKNKYPSSVKREKMCLKLQIFTSDEIVGIHSSWKFLLMSSSSFLFCLEINTLTRKSTPKFQYTLPNCSQLQE